MTFASPFFLFLLLLIPLFIWWASRRARRPVLKYSSIDLVLPLSRTIRQRLMWLPGFCMILAAACLIVALSRPREGTGEIRTTADGVAIITVIDRSASMGLPLRFEGSVQPRIDVVKRIFREFVLGNNRDLDGRPEDLIGLVTFARHAETVCPLSRIHDTLVKLVTSINLASEQWENGTAIGDGLALAAARLKRAEEELIERNKGEIDPEFELKSKAIVLLTDGDENYGETTASAAAQLCKEWGIRIYTIGIGDERGGVVQLPQGRVAVPRGDGFNEDLMKRIAAETGGSYFRATDGEALRRAYATIDDLETTEIHSVEYTSYNEVYRISALIGAAMLASSMLLSFTWLRRFP